MVNRFVLHTFARYSTICFTVNATSMQRASTWFYYVAVVSNVPALGVLLWGPLQRSEQVLAVMLTAISAGCWLRFFGQLSHGDGNRHRT
jgi:hypothetical protein